MSDVASPRLPIDERAARRLHERPRLAAADDFILREVSRRMAERLATVRHAATMVIDVGCGSGHDLAALRERFDGATVIGLDASRLRLSQAAAREPGGAVATLARLFGRRESMPLVQADLARLPIATLGVDALWSNLALHWSAEPHRVVAEWSRVLKEGGLVSFSAFGPDTLVEVAQAFGAVDDRPHVMPFTDMHDYGDMLVEAGFVTPVVDMERLTLTYGDTDSLWRDVRSLAGNASLGRIASLRGRGYRARLDRAMDRARDADGRLALTFELVFAHAWKGQRRTTADGEAIVRLQRRR